MKKIVKNSFTFKKIMLYYCKLICRMTTNTKGG